MKILWISKELNSFHKKLIKTAEEREHIFDFILEKDLNKLEEYSPNSVIIESPTSFEKINAVLNNLSFTTFLANKNVLKINPTKYELYILSKKSNVLIPKTIVLDMPKFSKLKLNELIESFQNNEINIFGANDSTEINAVKLNEFDSIIKKLSSTNRYLIQERLDYEKEIECLAIGSKVVCATSITTNKIKGQKLSSNLIELSTNFLLNYSFDFASISFKVDSNENHFVSNISFQPNFEKFQKANSGIDLATELIFFLEKKHANFLT